MARLTRLLTLGLALVALAAASWAQTPDLLTYEYTYEGSDEQRLIQNAERAALRETVGRFHFGDRLIIAREILENYLERNQSQYIAGVTVLERETDQGQYRLKLSIGVYARALEQAMEQYRFFTRPRQNPMVHVFLQETIDDAPEREPVALSIVQETLDDAGLLVDTTRIPSPASDIDVAEGDLDMQVNSTLREALVNAQRAGVELLLSGQSTSNVIDSPTLYYDQHHFFETTLLLRLLRADTGELIAETVVSNSGSDQDPHVAKEVAIRRCVAEAVTELTDTLYDRWAAEVLNQTDYQLMATNVDEVSLDLLEAKLADAGPNAQVFRRSLYGRTACINVNCDAPFAPTDIQARQGLVDYLVGLDAPQLKVESIDGSRIVLSVVR